MTELERWVQRLGAPADGSDLIDLTGDEWSSLGPDATFTAYTGIAHLLVSRVDPAERERRLASAEATLLSYEGPLHYKAFEVVGRAERLERAARMQGAEVRATRDWLIPRLRSDIERYEQRARALEQRLDGADA